MSTGYFDLMERLEVGAASTSFIPDDAPITKRDLVSLEHLLDQLYAAIGMDIGFTKHFLDRVNDVRNRKQITIGELKQLFVDAFRQYKGQFEKMKIDFEAVLTDLRSDINIPFAITWNNKQGELEIISKTIMRNKNFRTSNKKLYVR